MRYACPDFVSQNALARKMISWYNTGATTFYFFKATLIKSFVRGYAIVKKRALLFQHTLMRD